MLSAQSAVSLASFAILLAVIAWVRAQPSDAQRRPGAGFSLLIVGVTQLILAAVEGLSRTPSLMDVAAHVLIGLGGLVAADSVRRSRPSSEGFAWAAIILGMMLFVLPLFLRPP